MAPAAVDPIYQLKLAALWKAMKRQSPSFWLICLYLFFEYVRIQEIYQPLKGLPIPSWTIYLCGVAFLMEGGKLRQWTLADSLLALFTGVVVISSLTAWSPAQSFSEMPLFFSWVLIYFLITSIVNTERRFLLFMLLYLLYCVKMTQHGLRGWADSGFGFRSWGVTCAPSWFRNSGECGIQMSMLFPVSLFFILGLKPYWEKLKLWVFAAILPAGAVVTIIASSSRGAVLALAGLGIWAVARSNKRIKALLLATVVAGLVMVLLPETQMDRFREMGDDKNSVARLTYWEHGIEIANEHPVLGIGYRNWLPYYQEYYNPEGELPHNIFVEAVSELGYLGLLAFIGLIVGTFVLNHRTRRAAKGVPESPGRFFSTMAFGFDGALIAYIISGFFVTVLYYPFFWINLAMTVSLHCVTLTTDREARFAARPKRGFRSPRSDPPLTLAPARHGNRGF